MSHPGDDWDAEEHEALAGLGPELDELRRRHADGPSLAMLRAADADALPPAEQARVARHLQDSAWSRALVEGLRDTGATARLDAESEQRLFDRITRESQAAAPRPQRRWRPALAFGGLAAAATLLIAVVLSRSPRDVVSAPPVTPPAQGSEPPAQPAAPASPVVVAFGKPEVKLSPSALTWRGDPSASPFLRDLAPAFDAYRASDYARAVAAFDRLATVYPESIDVRFYQGVSHLLAGDAAGAIAPLDAAARIGGATFADDASWFLAVAEQRAGRPEARGRLTELCRGTGRHAAAACAAVSAIDAAPAPSRGR